MVNVVHKLPKKHKLLIVGFLVTIIALMLIPTERATASKDNDAKPLEVGKRYELQVKLEEDEQITDLNSPEQAQTLPTYEHTDYQVRNGDNLALIFKRAGFSAQTLYKLVNTNEETKKTNQNSPR